MSETVEEIFYLPVEKLSKMLESAEMNSVTLTKAYIDRIKALDGEIGAFLHIDEEYTMAQAVESDKRRAAGEALSPLDGVPIGIKDNISEKGQPLTCGGKFLEHYVSPYDAHIIENLKKAGAILLGRMNMDEMAMGSSNEHSAYKEVNNPWNKECSPGGSSGGSAAAVASGMLPLALGSDTGGSIRQPGAWCGIVGMKPTYGLVSRYGLGAFASSLDQIGPFAKTVEGAAMLLQVLAGHDDRDSTSARIEVPNYIEAIQANKDRTWKLGMPKEYFGEGMSDEVRRSVEAAVKFYESKGCTVEEVSLPNTDLAVPTYYIVAPAEASSNLARYDGVRYTERVEGEDGVDMYFKSRAAGFGKEVKRRIMIGTYVLSSGYYDAYYKKAQKVRSLIRADFEKAFESVDAIITPTSPNVAMKKGSKTDDPLAMYLEDIYTISANLAGIPGISVPCGFSDEGMPIGLQVLGKDFGEAEMFSVAHMFEQGHEYKNAHPKL